MASAYVYSEQDRTIGQHQFILSDTTTYSIVCDSLHRTPGPLENFTILSRLPAEIRSRIWHFAAFIPRNVQLKSPPLRCIKWEDHLHELDDEEAQRYLAKFTEVEPLRLKFSSPTPAPAMLHVCQEARREGLKCYKLAFEARVLHRSHIYINPTADTLFLISPDSCSRFTSWAFNHFGMHLVHRNVKVHKEITPWSEMGLKAQVGFAHPYPIGCCTQRVFITIIKAKHEGHAKKSVCDHVLELNYWGKLASVVEWAELRVWKHGWTKLLSETWAQRARDLEIRPPTNRNNRILRGAEGLVVEELRES